MLANPREALEQSEGQRRELESQVGLLIADFSAKEQEANQELVVRRSRQEGMARFFMAQLGYEQQETGRWLKFVEAVGQTSFVNCCSHQERTGLGRPWTMLQQWASDTVALPAAGLATTNTMELLVRLYGKMVSEVLDDEVVNLVRRLTLDTGTGKIGQVTFSLVLIVVEGYLDVTGESEHYPALAVSFQFGQLVGLMTCCCSREVGHLKQRIDGQFSRPSTPFGALWTLLGSDGGSELKDLIRADREISLPGGSGIVPARYCQRQSQDIGVLRFQARQALFGYWI